MFLDVRGASVAFILDPRLTHAAGNAAASELMRESSRESRGLFFE